MKRNLVLTVAAIAAVAMLVVMVAELTRPAEAAQGDGPRFTVTAGTNNFVLVDGETGKAWLLVIATKKGREFESAWFPIERLNSREEVMNWRIMNTPRN